MLYKLRNKLRRNSILKGIYEDNRRVFGNQPLIIRRRIPRSLRRALVLIGATIFLLFGTNNIFDLGHYGAFQAALWPPTPANSSDSSGESKQPGSSAAEKVSGEGFRSSLRPPALRASAATGDFALGVERTRDRLEGGAVQDSDGDSPKQPFWLNSETASLENETIWNPAERMRAIPLREMFGLGVRTIVIDPGHGGSDPGTAGKMGLQEKGIVLDIAKRLKKRLDEYGRYFVFLTREEDVTMSLDERIDFANSHRADLFISIHVNYLPSRPNNIIETYFFGLAENDAILELALLENADSMVGMNEFREMGEKLGGTLKLQESKRLAATIQESLYLNIAGNDGSVLDMGVKKAPFLVIMGTEMPGVLAEVTCLSNKDEEVKLRQPQYRENIASYLESGVLNYMNKGDHIYEARRR